MEGNKKMENVFFSENAKTSDDVQNVCLYNKHGYCKFRNLCRFHHVEEICFDNSCDVERCVRRHPKVCSYYREFKYCKFGAYFKFDHTETLNTTDNDKKLKTLAMQDLKLLIENKVKIIPKKKRP